MKILDPDRNWRSPDKRRHVLLFWFVTGVLTWFWPPIDAAVIAFLLGCALEAGQWDAVRDYQLGYINRDGDYVPALGQPGYGFGLLDLAANTVGIVAWLATYALLWWVVARVA